MTKRGEMRRAAREDARLDGYVDSGFWPNPRHFGIVHGICRRVTCGRRRFLFRPACVCDKCMPSLAAFVWAAGFFGVRL